MGRSIYAYVGGNPISRIDPLGLWWFGDSLPQNVVSAAGGVGDAALAMFFLNGQSVRKALNIDGGISTCSVSYRGGQLAGMIGTFVGGAGELTALNKMFASRAQLAQVLAGEGIPIIGAGTGATLGDAARLAAEYGGQASDWQKVTSASYTADDAVQFEIHAFQNSVLNLIVEAKTVFPGL